MLEPDARALELSGDVQATCGRYRMEADRLTIRTGSGDITIEGPARVYLCPCRDTPVAIGFERARVVPPGDLILRSPRLQVGETTVFVLPVAWIRSREEVGLLLPKVAWRGDGGLLLGSGVHVPWRDTDGSTSAIDISLAGYTSGGFEVAPTLTTSRSQTRVRFDRMDGTLWRVESEGALAGTAAWSADVARGDRVPEGLIDVREASRRFDSARAFVSARPAAGWTVGTGIELLGLRGAHHPLAWGPAALLDGAGPIGAQGTWDLAAGSQTLGQESGVGAHASRVEGGLELGSWVGPLQLRLAGRGEAGIWNLDGASGLDTAGWVTTRAALPLRRDFPRASAGSLRHVVEPFTELTLLHAAARGDALPALSRPPALAQGSPWIAAAGAFTALGAPDGAGAFEADAKAGAVGALSPAELTTPLLSASTAWHLPWMTTRGWAAAQLGHGPRRGGGGLWTRLGGRERAHLWGSVSYRTQQDGVDARVLSGVGRGWQALGWLDAPGTSWSAGLGAPVTRTIHASLATDWDGDTGTWLAGEALLGYRHPCGCLQASAQASRRVGRPGADAWLTLEMVGP